MIDLHLHTVHSDGELIPAELVHRAQAAGYRALALTDHADQSNLEDLVNRSIIVARALTQGSGMVVMGGVELTHLPPSQISAMIHKARELGAEIVIVHGETPVEPVARGTNRAAILGGADILAHPGFITLAEARLAKQKGVALELTSRCGHSLTNGYVAKIALLAGCRLVVNSDAHAPRDLHNHALRKKVVAGAGLPVSKLAVCETNAWNICRQVTRLKIKGVIHG